jgi:4-hydroxy-tetrahydrodipicolinate synthase
MKLQGSFVALVTPYSKGEVDLPKVRELVEFHVKNGTAGICPVATTGEGPVLTHDEKANIIKAVVEVARGKALVFPGTGTYNTKETIEYTRMAKELGADGALIVTPYYNKPTQEGPLPPLQGHRRRPSPSRSCSTTCPGRTGVSMAPETTRASG